MAGRGRADHRLASGRGARAAGDVIFTPEDRAAACRSGHGEGRRDRPGRDKRWHLREGRLAVLRRRRDGASAAAGRAARVRQGAPRRDRPEAGGGGAGPGRAAAGERARRGGRDRPARAWSPTGTTARPGCSAGPPRRCWAATTPTGSPSRCGPGSPRRSGRGPRARSGPGSTRTTARTARGSGSTARVSPRRRRGRARRSASSACRTTSPTGSGRRRRCGRPTGGRTSSSRCWPTSCATPWPRSATACR